MLTPTNPRPKTYPSWYAAAIYLRSGPTLGTYSTFQGVGVRKLGGTCQTCMCGGVCSRR